LATVTPSFVILGACSHYRAYIRTKTEICNHEIKSHLQTTDPE